MGIMYTLTCDACDEEITILDGVGMMGDQNESYYCEECGHIARRSWSTIGEPYEPPPLPQCPDHPRRQMRELSCAGLRPPTPRLMELFIGVREQGDKDMLRDMGRLLPRTDLMCQKCGAGTLILTGEGLWD
ncbi:hypothetical protein [Granulicoccus sp. GXG6511]|uniref:hypothetical protein n=1 Tax=Granulicoccus sp. GXG6511 TaxID=3381351 RepID=UPI003D7EA932